MAYSQCQHCWWIDSQCPSLAFADRHNFNLNLKKSTQYKKNSLLIVIAASERYQRLQAASAGYMLFPWSHPNSSNGWLLVKHPSQHNALNSITSKLKPNPPGPIFCTRGGWLEACHRVPLKDFVTIFEHCEWAVNMGCDFYKQVDQHASPQPARTEISNVQMKTLQSKLEWFC